MATNSAVPSINSLAADVIAFADQRRNQEAAAQSQITYRQYSRFIRGCFSRAAVREIIREARKAEPRLNRAPIRYNSMMDLNKQASRISASMGAEFRAAELSLPSGLALWGFYLSAGPGLPKRPLICVNSAHHRTAAAMAFGHEVGHHLTARLFGTQGHLPLPSLLTGFQSHLDDPIELAADIVVSLAMYPARVAEKFFSEPEPGPAKEAGEPSINPAIRAAADYFWQETGLEHASLSVAQRVQYQAGSIHFTRLRRALLEQYGI